MQDFETLGAFYLGKRHDLAADETGDELVLYDSADLTTHAVIIGMTGSGKTGLGIGMIEEAAIDRVPVIAIDPKGDLANLLLTFPELRAEDFRPWIDPREAAKAGVSPDEYAASQAELWKNGLAKWGQDGERIRRLREAADFRVYTPGSAAGIPVSVLRSFRAPPPELRADADLYRERIASTATGILALLGVEADPLTSREHILLANLLQDAWDGGRDLDIAGLIAAIQQPPMQKVGVMDLDTFYPARDRFALAMQLNNLLAAPGFDAWLEGEPLDVGAFLHDPTGKPRVSIFSIAHLSESERMFFVAMLLTEIVAWMRTQGGTGSLRALLYMDEVFGYLPPTANPPSKTPMLTLLKQARAYGLGVVLSTQNPVDLDYKALSNAGTWCIGRLQTERDKLRVLEGLEGAAAGGDWDRGKMEQTLAGLGKRVFLMHNVHEDEDVVFHTRWALSYLAGPMTREQIRTLMDGVERVRAAQTSAAPAAAAAASADAATPPALPPEIPQYYLPSDGGSPRYAPVVLGAADVHYSSSKHNVDEGRRIVLAAPLDEGPVPVDWADAERLDVELDDLSGGPADGATFADLPAPGWEPKNYKKWGDQLKRHLRSDEALLLWRSPELKEVSRPHESERDFRARLQLLAREQRDEMVAKLRRKYASRITTLQDRLRRSEQAIEREASQASQRKLDTAVSFGAAVFGALLGRKRISVTSASRVGTALKSAGRIGKEREDVERAEQSAEAVRQQLADLQAELEREVEGVQGGYDAVSEDLEKVAIKPKSSDIDLHLVGLGWRSR
jgi:hypothetical protein